MLIGCQRFDRSRLLVSPTDGAVARPIDVRAIDSDAAGISLFRDFFNCSALLRHFEDEILVAVAPIDVTVIQRQIGHIVG